MIEYGIVIFGLLTGNIMMSIAWVLLQAYNFIPVEYETLSAVGLMVLSIARMFIKSGGRK